MCKQVRVTRPDLTGPLLVIWRFHNSYVNDSECPHPNVRWGAGHRTSETLRVVPPSTQTTDSNRDKNPLRKGPQM